MPHGSVWGLPIVGQPEVKNDAVGLSGGFGNFLGLLRRPVQKPAPGQWQSRLCGRDRNLFQVSRETLDRETFFGDEVFHLFEKRLGFGGFVNQAFEHVTRYRFAVVMVGSHHFAIHLVWSQDMNIMAIGGGWAAFSCGGALGDPKTSTPEIKSVVKNPYL